MTGLALVLAALSIGDLVAGGLTGESTRVGRVALGTICAIGTPLILLPGTALPAEAAAGILIVTALASSGWLLLKLGLALSEQRQDPCL